MMEKTMVLHEAMNTRWGAEGGKTPEDWYDQEELALIQFAGGETRGAGLDPSPDSIEGSVPPFFFFDDDDEEDDDVEDEDNFDDMDDDFDDDFDDDDFDDDDDDYDDDDFDYEEDVDYDDFDE
jgi:hypothetical protein